MWWYEVGALTRFVLPSICFADSTAGCRIHILQISKIYIFIKWGYDTLLVSIRTTTTLHTENCIYLKELNEVLSTVCRPFEENLVSENLPASLPTETQFAAKSAAPHNHTTMSVGGTVRKLKFLTFLSRHCLQLEIIYALFFFTITSIFGGREMDQCYFPLF